MHDLLAEATELDRVFHESLRRIRERLYALELAEDPAFLAGLQNTARQLDEDACADVPGLTADEFAARYLVK